MPSIPKIFSSYKKGGIGYRCRMLRHALLLKLFDACGDRPLRILDIGGNYLYWKSFPCDYDRIEEILLLNLNLERSPHPKIRGVVGNGCHLPEYRNGEFDIIFSNSTIEHVGSIRDQRRMAEEVRRLGRAYFVQTPNYFFPMEPHYLVPGFQWMPVRMRSWLHARYTLGNVSAAGDFHTALEEIETTRLLRRSELEHFFPDASIYVERVCGLAKSFVAYRFPDGKTPPPETLLRDASVA